LVNQKIKNMKTINKIIISISLFALILSSCKKEETKISPPVPGNEFLTTVKWRFENAANSADTVWAVWRDTTALGGTNPNAFANIKKSTTYKLTVHLYDETQHPALDLTHEINVERANFHTYWFLPSGGIVNHVTFTATDYDTNNPPLHIGMTGNFVTDATVCSGKEEGVLRHQPNSKNGTYAPGSSDSDIFMNITIN